MYGLVNQAIREMVITRFGDEPWERIRAEAGADDVFIGMEQYPDEVTVALVGAACKVLDAQPGDVLRMFGEYWVGFTGEAYGELFRMSGDTLVSFVQNLNNLHTRVGQMMPELQPPSFTVTDLCEDSFKLHYHSRRPGLYPMIFGLMEGLGKRFGTAVTVTHLGGAAEGLDHDVFMVRHGAS